MSTKSIAIKINENEIESVKEINDIIEKLQSENYSLVNTSKIDYSKIVILHFEILEPKPDFNELMTNILALHKTTDEAVENTIEKMSN